MVMRAAGRTRATRVVARTWGRVTVPAWMSSAPPPRLTRSSTGMETQVKDRQVTVTRGIAQAR